MNEAPDQQPGSNGALTRSVQLRSLPADGTSKTIGLICNPNSGRNRKHLGEIEALINSSEQIVYVPTATENDIPVALNQFADADIDVLAINGGDGTVAHVLTHLFRSDRFDKIPPVILLPGGTTNMNVGDVGVPGKIVAVIKQLVDWSEGKLPTKTVVSRPVLRTTPGNKEPLFGMIFGTGAIIQAIEFWHSSVKTSGFRDEFSSGLAMLRTIWGLVRGDPRFAQPVHLDIELDNGGRITEDTMLMTVSCMPRVFLNFRPFWGEEQGALKMTSIRHGADRFLCAFLPVMRGKPNRLVTAEAGYHSHNINRLAVTMSGAFTMDGDIYHVKKEDGPVIIDHFCDLPFIRF